ncbi:undecaprenyl-diphosphate phosphatase [Candidatus Shapirobacteria bacterium]|nr:undecaprenyl-diphosphate phosphatase [Candidatus Shapirobacteria bacterium]
MTYFQALILSLVEGITEFLPVSSIGHLILASHLLGLAQTEFLKSFEIIIQLGAILAVVVLYWRTLFSGRRLLLRVLIAFIPTGLIGFFAYPLVKGFLLGNLQIVIVSLALGGILMLALEDFFSQRKRQKKIKDLNLVQVFLIGVAQSLALVPGVSRAMVTIFAGLGAGLSRKSATEFSFLLAIPTMVGAAGLDLAKVGFSFTRQEYLILLVGFLGAFLAALLTIKALTGFVKSHSFRIFAFYRIILAFVFWFFLGR